MKGHIPLLLLDPPPTFNNNNEAVWLPHTLAAEMTQSIACFVTTRFLVQRFNHLNTKLWSIIGKCHDFGHQLNNKQHCYVHAIMIRNFITYKIRELISDFKRRAHRKPRVVSATLFTEKCNQAIASDVKNLMYQFKRIMFD